MKKQFLFDNLCLDLVNMSSTGVGFRGKCDLNMIKGTINPCALGSLCHNDLCECLQHEGVEATDFGCRKS